MKEQPPIENQESKETTLPIAQRLFSKEMETIDSEIMPVIEKATDLEKQEMVKNLKKAVFSSLIALGTVSESFNQEDEKSVEQILEKIERLK